MTPESIEADLKAMPQRKAGQEQDKYYLGYFDVHQRLVAVMDFIDHYPDAQSGFIGFFSDGERPCKEPASEARSSLSCVPVWRNGIINTFVWVMWMETNKADRSG